MTSKYYEVFVSYNKSSQKWVDNHLVPFFEEKRRRKPYFLHYGEENERGEVFGPLIKDKMNNSAILLLVLSDAYIVNEFANVALKNHIRHLVTTLNLNLTESINLIVTLTSNPA